MKIHFQIEYTNDEENQCETLSSIVLDDEGREILHRLLDEYLNNNRDWDKKENSFSVMGRCVCSNK